MLSSLMLSACGDAPDRGAHGESDEARIGTAEAAIVTTLSAARLLDQTTFGPTPSLIAHVQQVGPSAFLDEQFQIPPSPWPTGSGLQRWNVVDAFFANATSGTDQLRQRVVFALSEVLVISMSKNTNANELIPWLALLSRNAFGNYRTLLKELMLDASMGKYLDLANSDGAAPNENYAREVMQLFTIGLTSSNLDGTTPLDGNGRPIPTYGQSDVVQLARALSGWTYGNASGIPPALPNYSDYPGPMLPVQARHDTSAKAFLGYTLPAGRTVQQDLDDVVNILFNHPNMGPFVATRLIRALVTSNPTPAYVARVATAFNNDGQGVRGDMKAVLRAVLLDTEARNDTPSSTFGRLRTPFQHAAFFVRTLGIDPGPASLFAYLFYSMDEGILDAPSVFGHYVPTYRIPKTSLFGPEFQIYSPSDAVNRAKLVLSAHVQPVPHPPGAPALRERGRERGAARRQRGPDTALRAHVGDDPNRHQPSDDIHRRQQRTRADGAPSGPHVGRVPRPAMMRGAESPPPRKECSCSRPKRSPAGGSSSSGAASGSCPP
ncbi:Hypothetical protein A7982_00229 [Minicystis rosea]|nr:Hypothetical protein A7982_00229 [Minicystis rosea]